MKVQGSSLQDLLASLMVGSADQQTVSPEGELELLLGTSHQSNGEASENFTEDFLAQLEMEGIDADELKQLTSPKVLPETLTNEKNPTAFNLKNSSMGLLDKQVDAAPEVNKILANINPELRNLLSIGNHKANKMATAQMQAPLEATEASNKVFLGNQGEVLKFKMENNNLAKNSDEVKHKLHLKNLETEGKILNPTDRPQTQFMMKSAMNSYVKNNGDAPIVKSQFKSMQDVVSGNQTSQGDFASSSQGTVVEQYSPGQNIFNKAVGLTNIGKTQTIELRGSSEQAIAQISNYILQMKSAGSESAQIFFKHNELGDIKVTAERVRGSEEILLSIQTGQNNTQAVLKDHQTDLVKALHEGGFKSVDIKISQLPSMAAQDFGKGSESSDFGKGSSKNQEQSSSGNLGKDNQQSGFSEKRQDSDRRKNLWSDTYERVGA